MIKSRTQIRQGAHIVSGQSYDIYQCDKCGHLAGINIAVSTWVVLGRTGSTQNSGQGVLLQDNCSVSINNPKTK